MRKILLIILLALTLCSTSWASLASTMVWEVRTTGNDLNGGGYTSALGGTDYSQQDAAQLSLSDLACANNTTLTSATGGFTAAMVGNVIYIASGTNFTPGNYEITARASTNSVTLDRNPTVSASATSGAGKVGGAKINIDVNNFGSILVAGNTVYIKNGTYTSSGSISLSSGNTSSAVTFIGYNSSRGDNPTSSTRPLLSRGANSLSFGTNNVVKCIAFSSSTGNSVTDNNGVNFFYQCKFSSTAGSGTGAFNFGGSIDFLVNCEFTDPSGRCITGFGSFAYFVGCSFHDASEGSHANGNSTFVSCIFNSITTPLMPNQCLIVNCDFSGAASPTGTGIDFQGGTCNLIMNSIIYGFTTGMNDNSLELQFLLNNDFFNNTTNRTNVSTGIGDLALDPQFTNLSGLDFSIGTNLKAQAIPGVFPANLSTTGYLDIGAVQRQEAGGSSGGSYTFVGN